MEYDSLIAWRKAAFGSMDSSNPLLCIGWQLYRRVQSLERQLACSFEAQDEVLGMVDQARIAAVHWHAVAMDLLERYEPEPTGRATPSQMVDAVARANRASR